MISIIICARKEDIAPELRKNIEETIGIPYEIIIINNAANDYTIFSAYNKGVSLSKFPLLLFMHDDILYHTNDWGKKLAEHFQDEKVGGVGIAGTPYLSFTTGGWWSGGAGHLHLLQSNKEDPTPVHHNYFPENSQVEEVVVLDGVWFCLRRNLFDRIRFDEATFSGFHFYDVDITLQVHFLGYKLLVVRDILIHHQSIGILDRHWVKNAGLFYKKWRDRLPVSVRPYPLHEQCLMEYRVLHEMMTTKIQNQFKEPSVYREGLRQLLQFRKGWLYHKTPVWVARLIGRYFASLFSSQS